ncbi:MAG: type IV toxin-antitoxin system AbiEi family antitoxin domain-containing protein [Acidimicrobiia bacterium]
MAHYPNNALPADLPAVFKWRDAPEAGITDRRLKRLTDEGMLEKIEQDSTNEPTPRPETLR